jgi:glutamyl-tRNA reductase
MKVFVAGVSFKTAPVEVRERLSVSPSRWRCLGCRLKVAGQLSELVLLSTCNRVELYGVGPRADEQLAATLFDHLGGGQTRWQDHLYLHTDDAALRHLFAVASGLDSMVLGETEITGQVKRAYQRAHELGLPGPILNRVFQTALQTAKAIRTRTAIGRGSTSVGSVAVDLVERIFGAQLNDRAVLIIGAGKMGEACVRHLAKKGVRSVLVANRSVDKAQALAREFNGRAIGFDQCIAAMAEADIVVSSTGCPHPILHPEDVQAALAARRQRPLFLIDIAVPRDIDPRVAALENVYLYDIDDLQSIVRENVRLRAQELALCERIIAERTADVLAKIKARLADGGRASSPTVARSDPERPAWRWSGLPAGLTPSFAS